MKIIIQIFLFTGVLLTTIPGLCQKDTTIYFGVNGRLVRQEKAEIRKEIDFLSSSKLEIRTFRSDGGNWQKLYTEKISRLNSGIYRIMNKGNGIDRLLERKYEKQPDGSLHFAESFDEKLIRTGVTLKQFPLLLQGEVKEYYRNGQIKSISLFENNELINNRNWLENGEHYIDSLFYTADEEPTLFGGNTMIHHHIRQAFKASGLDFSAVTGTLLLGFVVMETGDIKGIRVMKNLNPRIDDLAVKALQTLDGDWKPALLNGKPVRYFMLFPINFISRESTFQYMEFDGFMIHYDKN